MRKNDTSLSQDYTVITNLNVTMTCNNCKEVLILCDELGDREDRGGNDKDSIHMQLTHR